jgi:hypothetical protein
VGDGIFAPAVGNEDELPHMFSMMVVALEEGNAALRWATRSSTWRGESTRRYDRQVVCAPERSAIHQSGVQTTALQRTADQFSQIWQGGRWPRVKMCCAIGCAQPKMRCILGCANAKRGGGAQRNAFLNTPEEVVSRKRAVICPGFDGSTFREEDAPVQRLL